MNAKRSKCTLSHYFKDDVFVAWMSQHWFPGLRSLKAEAPVGFRLQTSGCQCEGLRLRWYLHCLLTLHWVYLFSFLYGRKQEEDADSSTHLKTRSEIKLKPTGFMQLNWLSVKSSVTFSLSSALFCLFKPTCKLFDLVLTSLNPAQQLPLWFSVLHYSSDTDMALTFAVKQDCRGWGV